MAALPYIQIVIPDYLSATEHLNAEQHGAYLKLIFSYWQTGKQLIDDDQRLANIARMSLEQWRINRKTLEEFFIISDGYWFHERIEKDLDEVVEKCRKAAIAGKESARKKLLSKIKGLANNSQRPFNVRSTDVDETLERNVNEESTQSQLYNNNNNNNNNTYLDHSNNKHMDLNKKCRTKILNPESVVFQNGGIILPRQAEGDFDNLSLEKKITTKVANEIFDEWKKIMNHPKAIFDDDRKRILTKALTKLKCTKEKAIKAIQGCKLSEFHMGKNDSNKLYDGINVIFANAGKIEGFVDLYENCQGKIEKKQAYNKQAEEREKAYQDKLKKAWEEEQKQQELWAEKYPDLFEFRENLTGSKYGFAMVKAIDEAKKRDLEERKKDITEKINFDIFS